MHSLFKTPKFPNTSHNIFITHRTFQSSSDKYANLIKIYGRDRHLPSGQKLHAHLITNGLTKLTHLGAKLISFYTECGKISDARKLFDKIPQSNNRRWIVLIGSYARRGFHQEAMCVFCEMQRTGARLSKFVIPSVLKSCGHLSDRKTGEKVHGLIIKCSFEKDAFVNSALIDMYSKCGRLEVARKVFNNMVDKDLVGLNALVSGHAQHGDVKKALVLVEESKSFGLVPNLITFNTLISGFAHQCDSIMVSDLFQLMHANGIEPDVVSWTSIISGFVQNFRNNQAFDAFKQMLNLGLVPSSATISTFLPVCASVADLKLGKEVHGYALVIGVEKDVYVSSALVDMYAKCGFISEAKILFHNMSEKNTVTYNSMIFGYANHGHSKEAISLFKHMENEGKKLDHLTFTAALHACSNAGLIELGKTIFKSIHEKYGLEYRLEHYACMVDLLGRAGKVEEAYELIKGMVIEPDFFVWGALLGACTNHGNIDLAEVAVQHLSKLEPMSSGSKVLLSNLYADTGSWSNVVKMKKLIKRRKCNKLPGCSWIESV